MTNQLQPFSNCPHLGLSGDASSVFMMATPSHCCFAGDDTFSPDLEYQAQYCLTQSHRLCSLCTSGSEELADSRFQNTTADAAGALTGTVVEEWDADKTQFVKTLGGAADIPAQPVGSQNRSEPLWSDSYQPEQPHANESIETSATQIFLEPDATDEFEADTVVTGIPDFIEVPTYGNPLPSADYNPTMEDGFDAVPYGASGAVPNVDSSWASYQPFTETGPLVPAQPMELPRQKERINFWPLAIGALALVGLLGLYAFSRGGIPSWESITNAGLSTQDDGAATLELPSVPVAEAESQGSVSNPGDGTSEQDTDTRTGLATDGGAFDSTVDGVGSAQKEGPNTNRTGVLVVTATPPTTATPAAPAESGAAQDAPTQDAPTQDALVQNVPTQNTVGNAGGQPADPVSISTPQNGGRIVSIKPQLDNAGWWSSEDLERNHLGDSYLYAGRFDGREYISAIRYDLREIARGADIFEATIQLTGLRDDRFDPAANAAWRVELISEKEFSGFSRANFLVARSAVAAYQFNPTMGPESLIVGETLTWDLTQEMRSWLRQQIVDGARSVVVRIQADVTQDETLFAWDTGQGSQTGDDAPWLVMSVGRAPETPPPFSTRPFIVATSTPVPKNILTTVAINQEATMVAQSIGTHTPVPFDIVTPTPYPENLATVQAVAVDRGLPPVVLPTRQLANAEERAAAAQYATAVAVTTGTFTPVPVNYVTPQLILPSPIAQNVATTVARTVTAQTQASVQTPTPLPYNAIVAEYVIATTLPKNGATAEARRVIAQAMAQTTGTPTPLPWHIFVVTPTRTPLPTEPPPEPTITPTPFLFAADGFKPTAEPQPPGEEEIPDTVPPELRQKIIFKSDRVNGQVETLAFDPRNGQTFVVNLPWVHGVARRVLAKAPDGQRSAVVASINDQPHIRIVRYENNEAKPISGIEVPGYDVAWSPSGGLIAYVSSASGNDEIYVMNEDGSGQKPITNTPTVEVKHPTWWNGQIVFHSNQTGRRQLWVMNADGSNARVLVDGTANDFEPIYVP